MKALRIALSALLAIAALIVPATAHAADPIQVCAATVTSAATTHTIVCNVTNNTYHTLRAYVYAKGENATTSPCPSINLLMRINGDTGNNYRDTENYWYQQANGTRTSGLWGHGPATNQIYSGYVNNSGCDPTYAFSASEVTIPGYGNGATDHVVMIRGVIAYGASTSLLGHMNVAWWNPSTKNDIESLSFYLSDAGYFAVGSSISVVLE